MFRAIKDILTEGRDETDTTMRQGKYNEGKYSEGKYGEGKYYEGKYETGTTMGAGPGIPGAGFTPVESKEFTREGVPIILERREAGPIVKEIIHPTEKVERQQLVRREREQVEVRELTQPILEKAAVPTQVHEAFLPEERKVMAALSADAIEAPLRRAKEGLAPSRTREVPIRTVEDKPPIIEETLRKKVYEEIVPVVERHVSEPHLIKEKKPIYEKVVEGPFFVTKELPRIEREAPMQFGEQWKSEQQRGAGYGGGYGAGYGGGRYAAEQPYSGAQYGTEGGYTRPGMVEIPIRTGTSYMRTSDLQPDQVRHTAF